MKITLFKPFEKFSTNHLLFMGLVATTAGSYLAYLFATRFDGVLDVHFSGASSTVRPFVENAINVLCLTVFLFVSGWMINKKTRLIDVIVAALVSRIPVYLMPLFNLDSSMTRIGEAVLEAAKEDSLESLSMNDMAWLGIVSLVSLVLLAWYILLLFNGFKVASNAKGTKHILIFSVSIILAEILSKILINNFT